MNWGFPGEDGGEEGGDGRPFCQSLTSKGSYAFGKCHSGLSLVLAGFVPGCPWFCLAVRYVTQLYSWPCGL